MLYTDTQSDVIILQRIDSPNLTDNKLVTHFKKENDKKMEH